MADYKVSKYVGNVIRSMKYSAKDAVKSTYFPSVFEFSSNNSELARSIVTSIRTRKNTDKRTIDQIEKSPIIRAAEEVFKNATEDIKSGNFYNKERVDKETMKAFGFEDNFGMDFMSEMNDSLSSLEDDESAFSTDAMLTSSTISKSSATMTDNLSKAIVRSSEISTNMSMEYDKAKTSMLIGMNQKFFDNTTGILGNIDKNITTLVDFHNEAIKTHIENSTNFFNEVSSPIKDTAGYMKEFVEMQRNMYDDYTKSKALERGKQSNYSKVFGSGGFDISAYMDTFKGGGGGGMLDMFTGDMGAGFRANPLQFVTASLLSSLIGGKLKNSMANLDKSVGNFFTAGNMKLNSLKESDNMIISKLAKIFAVDTSLKSNVNTNAYVRGPIPFDGETKRAIINIDSTLNRIESHMTGKEVKSFNYEDGKYETLSEAKKRYTAERDRPLKRGMTEYNDMIKENLSPLMSKLNDPKSRDMINGDIDELMLQLVKTNTFFNPNKTSLGDLSRKGINLKGGEKSLDLIKTGFKNMSKGDQIAFQTAIQSTRNDNNKTLEDIEKNLDNKGLSFLFDDSVNKNVMKDGESIKSVSGGILNDIKKILLEGIITYNGGVNGVPKSILKRSKDTLNIDTKETYNKTANRDATRKTGSMNLDDMDSITKFINDENDKSLNKRLKKEDGFTVKGLDKTKLGKYNHKGQDFVAGMADNATNKLYETIYGISDISDTDKSKSKDGKKKGKGPIDKLNDKIKNIDPAKLKDNAKGYAKSLGAGIFGSVGLGMLFGSPLLGAIGSIGSIVGSTEFAKSKLFGKMGEDGGREDNGILNKKIVSYMKESLPKAGLGALGSTLLSMGLFGSTLGMFSPILGAGLGFAVSSEKVKSKIFGEVDDETGERKGGLLTDSFKDKFKKFGPSMGIGGATGMLLGNLIAGSMGPLGALAPLVMTPLGISLGWASKSEKVKNMIFGEMDEKSGKKVGGILNDEMVKKFKKFAPAGFLSGIGGSVLGGMAGGAFGGLLAGTPLGFMGGMFGPMGVVGGTLLGSALGIATQTENFKSWLFGEIDPEDDKRKGGLLSTVSTNIGKWFETSIKNPFIEALGPINDTFKDFKTNMKDLFVSGWESTKSSIGDIFESQVGKPLGEIVKEKVGDPLKGLITKLVMGTGKLLGSFISAPVKGMSYLAASLVKDKKVRDGIIKDDSEIVKDLDKKDPASKKITNSISKIKDKMKGVDLSGIGSKLSIPKLKVKFPHIDFDNLTMPDIESLRGKIPAMDLEALKKNIPSVRLNMPTLATVGVGSALASNAPSSIKMGDTKLSDAKAKDSKLDKLMDRLENLFKKTMPDTIINKDSGVNNKLAKASLTNEGLDNINRLKPIENYLSAISKEIRGQLDGAGYNLESIKNILRTHLGDSDIKAKGMKGERGNNKRKGKLGKLFNILTSPFTSIMKMGKGIADKANPFKLIKKGTDFTGNMIKSIFKLPKATKDITKSAGKLIGKSIGKVIDTGIKGMEIMTNAGIETIKMGSSVIKAGMENISELGKSISNTIAESFKHMPALVKSLGDIALGFGDLLGRGAKFAINTVRDVGGSAFDSLFNRGKKDGKSGSRRIQKVEVVGGILDKIKLIDKINLLKATGGVGEDYVKLSGAKVDKDSSFKKLLKKSGEEDQREIETFKSIKKMANGKGGGALSGLSNILKGGLGSLLKMLSPLGAGGLGAAASLLPAGVIAGNIKQGNTERAVTGTGRLLAKNKFTAKAINAGGNKALSLIKKIFSNEKVMSKLGGSKITSKIVPAIEKVIAKNPDAIMTSAAKIGGKAGGRASAVGGTAGVALIAFALWDLTTGMAEARKIFKLSPDSHVTFKMRVAAGVGKFISGLLFGVDELAQSFVAPGEGNWIATLVYKAIADVEEEHEMADMQSQFKKELETYNSEKGTNLSMDEYNKKMNKGVLSKIVGAGNFIKDKAMDLIKSPKDFIGGLVGAVNDKILTGFNNIKRAIKDGPKAIGKLLGKSARFIFDGVISIKDGIVDRFDKAIGFMENIPEAIWSKFKNGFSWITNKFDSFTELVKESPELIVESVKGLGTTFKETIFGLKDTIMDLPENIADAIVNLGHKIKDKAKDTWNGVKNFGSNIKNGILNFTSGLREGWYGEGDRSVYGMGDSIFYSQKDPSWSDVSMRVAGDKKDYTIGDVGCGPTALAMSLSSLDIPATPIELSRKAVMGGYRKPNDGTSFNFFTDVAKQYGANVTTVRIRNNNDKSRILQAVRDGKSVIVQGRNRAGGGSQTPFKSNPHYVVLVDEQGKNFVVNDPLAKKGNLLYNKDIILNQISVAFIIDKSQSSNTVSLLKSIGGISAYIDKLVNGMTGGSSKSYGPQNTDFSKLVWGGKNSDSFNSKVINISNKLGIDPNHLMSAMAFETGGSFSPSERNKASGATGLIQFMPNTAKSLGTTTNQLAGMSQEKQLDYVYKYFKNSTGKLNTLSDVYSKILYPKAIGKSEDYVLFNKGTIQYKQNKGLDLDRSGTITKREAANKVYKMFEKGKKYAGKDKTIYGSGDITDRILDTFTNNDKLNSMLDSDTFKLVSDIPSNAFKKSNTIISNKLATLKKSIGNTVSNKDIHMPEGIQDLVESMKELIDTQKNKQATINNKTDSSISELKDGIDTLNNNFNKMLSVLTLIATNVGIIKDKEPSKSSSKNTNNVHSGSNADSEYSNMIEQITRAGNSHY